MLNIKIIVGVKLRDVVIMPPPPPNAPNRADCKFPLANPQCPSS